MVSKTFASVEKQKSQIFFSVFLAIMWLIIFF